MPSAAEAIGRLRRLLQLQLARFIIVGGATAALLMGLTFGFLRAGAPPFAGGLAAYAITFGVAYLLQRNWTFQGAGRHARTLPRYFTVQLGCGLTSGGISHLLAGTLGWPPAAASAVMTVCVSAVSYFASSLWVFRR
jgi:putative flippase GtrA